MAQGRWVSGILARPTRIGSTASQKIPQIANRQPGGRRIDGQKRLIESRSEPARTTHPGPIPIFLVHVFLLSPAPAGIRSPSAGSRQTANTAPIHRSDELPGLLKKLIMGMQIRLGHNDVFGSEPCREIVACSEALSSQPTYCYCLVLGRAIAIRDAHPKIHRDGCLLEFDLFVHQRLRNNRPRIQGRSRRREYSLRSRRLVKLGPIW